MKRKDKLSVIQIEQDIAVCAHKFSSLVCRPVGAQFMAQDIIVLFEFEEGDDGVRIAAEKHYKLVAPEEMSDADLKKYRSRKAD